MAGGSSRSEHWDAAYASGGVQGVSWYQPVPVVALGLIEALGVQPDAAVLDVGGGGSALAGELVARGFGDVTVLDVSAVALAATCESLPAGAPVRCVEADILEWMPDRRYELWHDRAVFHFLVEPMERERYLAALHRVLAPGGVAVLGTFATDGPGTCSGLPVCRYSAGGLGDALGDAFDVVATRRETHVTPRGVVQPFTWVAARFAQLSQPSR
jgi:SAM-dependent methyltransferase